MLFAPGRDAPRARRAGAGRAPVAGRPPTPGRRRPTGGAACRPPRNLRLALGAARGGEKDAGDPQQHESGDHRPQTGTGPPRTAAALRAHLARSPRPIKSLPGQRLHLRCPTRGQVDHRKRELNDRRFEGIAPLDQVVPHLRQFRSRLLSWPSSTRALSRWVSSQCVGVSAVNSCMLHFNLPWRR